MTDVVLREPAGVRTSFVQQLRLIGWSRRWVSLVLALLFFFVAAGMLHADLFLGLQRTLVAGMFGLPLPVLWGLMVWQGELSQRCAYHCSLPVARPGHDLARIAAGAVWLFGAYLVLAVAGAIIAAASGDWARFTSMGSAWTTFFAGPLVLYLLVAPLVLWHDSTNLRRGIVLLFVLGISAVATELAPALKPAHDAYQRVALAVFGDGWGLSNALVGGFLRQAEWERRGPGEGSAAALWLGIGLAATACAATWRPADVARAASRLWRR